MRGGQLAREGGSRSQLPDALGFVREPPDVRLDFVPAAPVDFARDVPDDCALGLVAVPDDFGAALARPVELFVFVDWPVDVPVDPPDVPVDGDAVVVERLDRFVVDDEPLRELDLRWSPPGSALPTALTTSPVVLPTAFTTPPAVLPTVPTTLPEISVTCLATSRGDGMVSSL
jgi:hypothetical protein